MMPAVLQAVRAGVLREAAAEEQICGWMGRAPSRPLRCRSHVTSKLVTAGSTTARWSPDRTPGCAASARGDSQDAVGPRYPRIARGRALPTNGPLLRARVHCRCKLIGGFANTTGAGIDPVGARASHRRCAAGFTR